MKKKIQKKLTVPILNDTYEVYVNIGDKDWANADIAKYLGADFAVIDENNRGKSIYRNGFHPCIWVDGRLPWQTALGTLSHEAIHAVSHIMEYLGMDPRDLSGNEFLAHSVGAVVRTVLKTYKL